MSIVPPVNVNAQVDPENNCNKFCVWLCRCISVRKPNKKEDIHIEVPVTPAVNIIVNIPQPGESQALLPETLPRH